MECECACLCLCRPILRCNQWKLIFNCEMPISAGMCATDRRILVDARRDRARARPSILLFLQSSGENFASKLFAHKLINYKFNRCILRMWKIRRQTIFKATLTTLICENRLIYMCCFDIPMRRDPKSTSTIGKWKLLPRCQRKTKCETWIERRARHRRQPGISEFVNVCAASAPKIFSNLNSRKNLNMFRVTLPIWYACHFIFYSFFFLLPLSLLA